jgi:hypothetical protein
MAPSVKKHTQRDEGQLLLREADDCADECVRVCCLGTCECYASGLLYNEEDICNIDILLSTPSTTIMMTLVHLCYEHRSSWQP